MLLGQPRLVIHTSFNSIFLASCHPSVQDPSSDHQAWRDDELGLHWSEQPSQKEQVIRSPAKSSTGKALTCLAHHRAESVPINMGSPLSALHQYKAHST